MTMGLKTAVRDLFVHIGVDPDLAECAREDTVKFLVDRLTTLGANLDDHAYEQEREAKRWGDDDTVSRYTRDQASNAYAAATRI